jgi:Putative Actinobacterial Holin-X, holin superfamily III
VAEPPRVGAEPGDLAAPAQMHLGAASERALGSLSTTELVREVTSHVGMLAKKQVELAKAELRGDLRREVAMASGLGIGALAGILTLNMLFVTLVLALSTRMAGWLAALLVSLFLAGIAAIAGLIGWSKRVRRPLERTRRTLKEQLRATRERVT